MADRANVSGDLIWEVVRKFQTFPNNSRTHPILGNSNSYLVKRKSGGGVQFSRDPFNLTNKHSRKHAGFVNEKAVSIQPDEKGGVTLVTKKANKSHTPSSHHNTHGFKSSSSNRK